MRIIDDTQGNGATQHGVIDRHLTDADALPCPGTCPTLGEIRALHPAAHKEISQQRQSLRRDGDIQVEQVHRAAEYHPRADDLDLGLGRRLLAQNRIDVSQWIGRRGIINLDQGIHLVDGRRQQRVDHPDDGKQASDRDDPLLVIEQDAKQAPQVNRIVIVVASGRRWHRPSGRMLRGLIHETPFECCGSRENQW